MNSTESSLISGLKEMDPDFSLTEDQLGKLRTFYSNLTEWNKVMNLTAITEEKDVYTKHFLDSLSILKVLDHQQMSKVHSLIDVGTGAGFPGLVLAIAFPDIRVTLMDSLNKRIHFLEDTVEKLQLANVTCIHSRAEDLARNSAYREKFDLAVSRAVANLSTLSEYCLPFVKVGGAFIPYKTEKAEEELSAGRKAVSVLGGKITEKKEFVLPGTDYSRVLLIIRKEKPVPKKYPRKAGLPAKEPLGNS